MNGERPESENRTLMFLPAAQFGWLNFCILTAIKQGGI
jgi:hypothetical protein